MPSAEFLTIVGEQNFTEQMPPSLDAESVRVLKDLAVKALCKNFGGLAENILSFPWQMAIFPEGALGIAGVVLYGPDSHDFTLQLSPTDSSGDDIFPFHVEITNPLKKLVTTIEMTKQYPEIHPKGTLTSDILRWDGPAARDKYFTWIVPDHEMDFPGNKLITYGLFMLPTQKASTCLVDGIQGLITRTKQPVPPVKFIYVTQTVDAV